MSRITAVTKTAMTAMEERRDYVGSPWREIGRGYFVLWGVPQFPVMYLAIPKNHPLANCHYDNLPGYGPRVNGGITFSSENVFGWDYAHASNPGKPEKDFLIAYDYFSVREGGLRGFLQLCLRQIRRIR